MVLVTGAYGCIGAWVVPDLVQREIAVERFRRLLANGRLAAT